MSHQSEEKPYPSVRKRSNLAREDQLHQIAGLHLEGRSRKEIAERFGLSKSQICRDLKEINQRWKSSHGNEEAGTLRRKELTRIDHIEELASKAFERSCLPEETQSQEKTSPDPVENVAGNHGKRARTVQEGRLKASLRTKNRDGNPAFLRIMAECSRMRCALLGVEAPKKAEGSGGADPVQVKIVEIVRDPSTKADETEDDSPPPPSSRLPAPIEVEAQAPPPATDQLRSQKEVERHLERMGIVVVEPPIFKLNRALAEFSEECDRQDFK